MPTLEFFFDYISPYSYLASTRVEAVAARTGAELRWRPFYLGGVFKATGNTSPAFNEYKARYLLKDLNDWAQHYELPEIRFPEGFPAGSLRADRVGIVAGELGQLPAFSRALYRRVFVEGRNPGEDDVLTEALREAGIDAALALERAGSEEVKEALRKNTEEAVARGSFGAPTFFVGEEMFLGNDRLFLVERALERVRAQSAREEA